MGKDEILAALPKLDRAALEAIQAVTTTLLQGRTGAIGTADHGLTQHAFTALAATLGQPTAYKTFACTEAGKRLQKRLPEFEVFLDKAFEGWGRNLISQQALFQMLFGLLADDLSSRGVRPTLGIMVMNLGRLPEVFDAQFPGYRQAGLGKMVLKGFQHGR